MRTPLMIIPSALLVASLLAFGLKNKHAPFTTGNYLTENKKAAWNSIVRCSPDWNEIGGWIDEVDIPPIPGAGSYTWKINTGSDSAQFYFNQGINMYYSFHIIEAMASFKKASRLDPRSALLYWAQALAYGPNINDVGYAASPDALAAIEKARSLTNGNNIKEKLLIEAQASRYSRDSTQSREYLNQLYADKMKALYQKYPADADIAALYADAMMLQHPWDLWNKDGTPRPWTPAIQKVLETLLVKAPNHPGANHYYIHVMEPSPFAAKALASADRLGKLTPGLSHTVHMPSHIYLRTGYYEKGMSVNEDAVNAYKRSIPMYAPVVGADFLYIIHNLHMQTNNAMMAGQMAYAVQSASETVNSIQPDYLAIPGAMGNYIQYIYMTPVLVDIRFGRWESLIERKAPDSSLIYANVLYHFGRGIAYSKMSDLANASKELDEMREWMKDSSLTLPFSPFAAAIEGAQIAEQLLLGVIHEQKNLADGAIRHFRIADSIEIKMTYNEPRDWLLNPKQFLGNALLKGRKFSEAEKTFRADLAINNRNGWSLLGLSQSLEAQKKNTAAAAAKEQHRKAFEKSDIKPQSAVL